jgi:hypothetical protein
MEIILLNRRQIYRLLLDVDRGFQEMNGGTIYFFSIMDVLQVVEKLKKTRPHHEALLRITQQPESLFQSSEVPRYMNVADLDEDGLRRALFDQDSHEFDLTFWKPGSDLALTPAENLGALTLRIADMNWRTNLVTEYLDR